SPPPGDQNDGSQTKMKNPIPSLGDASDYFVRAAREAYKHNTWHDNGSLQPCGRRESEDHQNDAPTRLDINQVLEKMP
ncbi:unnamed protein product, partial [Amoebophrya sp. A25]